MGETGASKKVYPLKSLVTGIVLSAVLSLFFYSGILVTYKYLPESILLLIGLTILCSVIFWMIIKFDQYLEVNEVFYKTISFDFKLSNIKTSKYFTRFIRPLNPYIGALGTIAGLLIVLWVVPALIIYLVVNQDPSGKPLKITVLFMSVGISISYYLTNKDQFPSVADKFAFFIGIILGPVGVINIIS